jgi:HD-like signal output (HDOD) protein
MDSYFKTIIDKIPPLPESILRIEALAKDPDITYQSIASILNKDPLLTAEVLKSANSPIYGFSREINTLESAISLFGMGTIRGFILAAYIRENFDFTLEPYGLTSAQFLMASLKYNALASHWYLKKEPKLLNVLSPATFLLKLGEILTTQYLLEHNQNIAFAEALLSGKSVNDIEKKFCSTTAIALSSEIFDYWSLDDTLVCTLRFMTHPYEASYRDTKTAQILHCIDTAIKYNGTLTKESIDAAIELVETYDLDLPSFLKAIEKIK